MNTEIGNQQLKSSVYLVGKIDREIYKCITQNIITEEVIITDERIEHIKERHPITFDNIYRESGV